MTQNKELGPPGFPRDSAQLVLVGLQRPTGIRVPVQWMNGRHGKCFSRTVAGIFTAVGGLERALDYHLERHNLLAANVAHVDTPGYRPVDLARTEEGPSAVLPARTHASHLVVGGGLTAGRVFEDPAAGGGLDGNFVSLDREAAKLAANQLRFDVVSAVVTAELRQLTYAAADGR